LPRTFLINKDFQGLLYHGGEPSEFGIFFEVTGMLGDFLIATNGFSSVAKTKTAAIMIPSYRINTWCFVVLATFPL
jgi:hypothetical protein